MEFNMFLLLKYGRNNERNIYSNINMKEIEATKTLHVKGNQIKCVNVSVSFDH